jgi:hypothetical protein
VRCRSAAACTAAGRVRSAAEPSARNELRDRDIEVLYHGFSVNP